MTNIPQNSVQIQTPAPEPGSFLDKLAQPVTDQPKENGTTLETYKKRARAKYLSRALVLEMVKIDSPLKKSYWNTWHCSNIIKQDGKKLTTTYCNNRWCAVCNRIRMGKLIKGYLPELKKMEDPQFITLTTPNVFGDQLQGEIEEMTRQFIKIKDLFKNRRTFRINGIRKIEVTHNAATNEFNPHFHVVLDGKQVGEELINEWLKRFPEAKRAAQDIRPANENSMIELFKYTTKLTTKDLITKEGEKTVIEINPEALDTIFLALYKKRTFQNMGWVKKVSEDVDEIDAQEVEDVQEYDGYWRWEQEVSDWVNSQGELLTGCDASQRLEIRIRGS